MRVNGEWMECRDGDTRPVIRGEIQLGDERWLEVEFLVDTGADRTVLSSDILNACHLFVRGEPAHLGGVGGMIESAVVQAKLFFRRDDGVRLSFRGDYAAFAQPDALDMSILGRDILDMFALIVDRPADVVAILGGQHRYLIQVNS